MRVTGASAWKPKLHDAGGEWRLTATCPTCSAGLFWNVQPPPWLVVADKEPADPQQFEARRAAGKVRHVSSASLSFQLWCYRDEVGADVVIHGGAAS